MKVNKFSLTYLAGMVMILISGCFPFLGYRFTMKDYQDVKEWFLLLNLKKLADRKEGYGSWFRSYSYRTGYRIRLLLRTQYMGI